MENARRNVGNRHFLGEIESEIVGMRHGKASILPGEQVNLEPDLKNAQDRPAIRVENGQFEPVGFLPKRIASWLAPLIDDGQIHLDGYVPQVSLESEEETSSRSVILMVFLSEKGRQLLEKTEPHNAVEILHRTILQAYENAQKYGNPESILGLGKELEPLEKQDLLPETRLLLALLPRMAYEVRISQGVRTAVRFWELLTSVILGEPRYHHNLTFFPLLWPESHEASYKLFSEAIEAGEAIVEEVSDAGSGAALAVTNRCDRPLLIPEGEILVAAMQDRVINISILVAAGMKVVLPVICVEASRRQCQSGHFESKICAPPSLRRKTLKAVHQNRLSSGSAASDPKEFWDEAKARSEKDSLTDGFVSAEEKLKELRKHLPLPEGAAGVLVGCHHRIIGMDLFDSPTTLRVLWNRLANAYCFDALQNPGAAPPTSLSHAQRFIERVGGTAKPRVPALALGEELEIASEGLVGAALLYERRLCHLAAFSDEE